MDRAEVAVRKARDTTAYLQDQWRSHLFRISFLVLLVSFHQCSTPMQACIHNIKVRMEILWILHTCIWSLGCQAFIHFHHMFLACQQLVWKRQCHFGILSILVSTVGCHVWSLWKHHGSFLDCLFIAQTAFLFQSILSPFGALDSNCAYVLFYNKSTDWMSTCTGWSIVRRASRWG